MRSHPIRLIVWSLLGLTLACGGSHHHHDAPAPLPRRISLEIEVYDPATNRVWQGVTVRVIEAEHEWSALIVDNPNPTDAYLTDDQGVVFFDSNHLGAMSIGFIESVGGHAVLEPDLDADEAWVQVELSAPGFPTVRTDAYLSWEYPDGFLSIPYSPLP